MAANDHSSIRLGAVPETEGHDYTALAAALEDTSTWFQRAHAPRAVDGIAYCKTHDHVWLEGDDCCFARGRGYTAQGCVERPLFWRDTP